MIKPKAVVVSGYGLNCEEETAHAFTLAGAKADMVHINDFGKNKLKQYQILAFPGGFSYGDDTGAGNAFSNRVRNHLWEQLLEFIEKQKLIIGICNGCQIIANTGLIPALKNNWGKRQVAFTYNEHPRYLDRWVDLKVVNQSPWLKDISSLSLPIAHGEGNFYTSEKIIADLKQNRQIALTYMKGEVCTYQNLPANPNGSLENIAGITDTSGRILGLMPHPERAMFFTQLPHWPYLKETYLRNGQPLPEFGPGLQIFQNGVNYFKL